MHRESMGTSSLLLMNTLKYCYVHRKFDALDKFIEFNVKPNNLLGKHIKAF